MATVRNNAADHRYEVIEDDEVAFAAYEIDGRTISFTHTIVPRRIEGGGVGSRLIAAALDDVRARGLRFVPQCAFVAAYIERHPEYRDMLA